MMQLLRRGKSVTLQRAKYTPRAITKISLTVKALCGGHETHSEEFQSTHSALFSINAKDYSKEKGHIDDHSFHIIRR